MESDILKILQVECETCIGGCDGFQKHECLNSGLWLWYPLNKSFCEGCDKNRWDERQEKWICLKDNGNPCLRNKHAWGLLK